METKRLAMDTETFNSNFLMLRTSADFSAIKFHLFKL